MISPIITLLSDFGTSDTFVGQMKGVLLSRCPGATMVDLSHEIPPQSILAGALHLRAAWRSFPTGTVHLAVVDPGVGTDRRAIALDYQGHVFVLPDNGLITAVLDDDVPDQVVELDPSKLNSSRISSTFHGRDVFAPAAGVLAAGRRLSEVGAPISPTTIARCQIPRVQTEANAVTGEIVLIDHFGNCITNIQSDMLECGLSDAVVRVGGLILNAVERTYQNVNPGEPVALVSSMGTIEIAIRDGSAAQRFAFAIGTPVQIARNNAPEPSSSERW